MLQDHIPKKRHQTDEASKRQIKCSELCLSFQDSQGETGK